jgi:hypothetical protein
LAPNDATAKTADSLTQLSRSGQALSTGPESPPLPKGTDSHTIVPDRKRSYVRIEDCMKLSRDRRKGGDAEHPAAPTFAVTVRSEICCGFVSTRPAMNHVVDSLHAAGAYL